MINTGNGYAKGKGQGSGNRFEAYGVEGVREFNAATAAATQEKAALLSLAAQDQQLEQAHEDAKAANDKQNAEQEALNVEGVMQVDNLKADAVDKAQTAIDESCAGGRPPEAERPPVEA